ncbi:hypothetical protein D8B26_003125 [Coccidioides posadasii str. Silveira]|nr:hypothetical protein D8B26_003125 [Coccidioides posadasii str. Silveira]
MIAGFILGLAKLDKTVSGNGPVPGCSPQPSKEQVGNPAAEDERECKMRTMLDRHLGRFPEPLVAPEQEYQTNQDDLQRSVKRPVAFT